MKTETIQIDKAGRVVLPKPLREQFNLVAGDKLRVSVEAPVLNLSQRMFRASWFAREVFWFLRVSLPNASLPKKLEK